VSEEYDNHPAFNQTRCYIVQFCFEMDGMEDYGV